MCSLDINNLTQIQNEIYKHEHKIPNILNLYSFTLNNTYEYFNTRLKLKVKNTNSEIYKHLNFYISDLNKSKTTSEILNTYLQIFTEIYEHLSLYLNENNEDTNNFNWDSLELQTLHYFWEWREVLVCLTFYTLYIFKLNNITEIKILNHTRSVNTLDTVVHAFGSTTYKSDIDITITGSHASSTIAILEDLWEYSGWFNNRNFKVDLYGDFTLIGEYYIDTHNLSTEYLTQLFKLSLFSYFRHDNSNQFDNELLLLLSNYINDKYRLNLSSSDLSKSISNAQTLTSKLDVDNRELYYTFLNKAEVVAETAIHKVESTAASKNNELCRDHIVDIFGDTLVKLGIANLFRRDNYILTSTIVQVVKVSMETLKASTCNSFLTTVASCSISDFSKLLCAIEQIGYLQHYKYLDNCVYRINKYLGRFIASIKDINGLKIDKKILRSSKKFSLDIEKRRKREEPDLCELNIDLYYLALSILE